MSKTTLLLKEIGARITGNSTKAQSAKIGRKCVSKIDLQIASLGLRKIELEDKLDTRQEALATAKFPSTSPIEGSSYTDNIKDAYEAVGVAEEDIQDVNDSLDFFRSLILEFDKKVDVTDDSEE